MAYLPGRDLSLDRRFVVSRLALALAPALGLAALGLAALVLTCEDVARLRVQDEIAAHGARAAHARVDIERDVSFFLFRARRYDVAFEDAAGRAHTSRVREHDVSIAPLVVEGPPDVRYDPSDPSRLSVGFARQNEGAQWAAVALLGSSSTLFLALAALVFLRLSRSLRAARGAARAPRVERIARVTSCQASLDSAGQPTGEQHLVLALEEDAAEHLDSYRVRSGRAEGVSTKSAGPTFEIVTDPADPPCFVDASCERLLVVGGRSEVPTLVRRSGYPFVLDERERRELMDRAPWLPMPAPRPASPTPGRARSAGPALVDRG